MRPGTDHDHWPEVIATLQSSEEILDDLIDPTQVSERPGKNE
jgi:hypothetical protein